MAIIEEKETTVKEIKETETTRHIECDVCEDSWPEDADMVIHEFSIEKTTVEEFKSLDDLADAIEAYHTKQPVEAVKEADGVIDVPKTNFIDAVKSEAEMVGTEAGPHVSNVYGNKSGHTDREREELEELIGEKDFYLKDGFLHHFMYRVRVERTSTETRHVCDDCYKIVF